MPGPLAPFIGFALGVTFAWAGREELARRRGASDLGARSLALAASYAGLVFAPVAAYFIAFEPDWSFAYLVDPSRVPSALELLLVMVDGASIPAGFFAAAPFARTRKLVPVLTLAGPFVVIVLGGLTLSAGRLSVQASYAQFHGDFGTRPVSGSALGYALLWLDTLLVGGMAFTLRHVQRVARPSRS